MTVASRLRLAFAAVVLAAPPCAATPLAAAPLAAAGRVAVVDGVSFSTDGAQLTVRVRTTERPRSVSVDRQGRTVQLVLVGAHLSPAPSRGRAEAPVRDYRLDASGDRVTVTFDAPGSDTPRASIDERTSDVLLTFGGAPPTAEAPRRMVAWGGVAVPRSEPVAAPEPTRRTTPRRRTPPPASVPASVPAATRSSGPSQPYPTPQPGPAPSGSTWANAPQVVVPMTPDAPATYAGTGDNWRLDTIVLDAGHGGHEPGGVGLYGVTDSKVALAVVMRLGPRIERELGIRVVYTRDSDRFVKLDHRGPMANRARAKLFVSVHGNVGAPSASGTETFFLAPRGSASAREVMMRENEIVRSETDPSLYAAFDNEPDIITALAMSAYQEESQFLAGLVEREFVNQGRRSRGVKQDNFRVLREASMPAILVETGFVSNPEEARYLSSERGLDEVADALYRAIRAYKEHYESGLHLGTR